MNRARRNAIDALELLGSYDEQRKYQRSVPIANVAVELACLWFDDFWTPLTAAERPEHDFSEHEWRVLERFTAFYDARTPKLPETLEAMLESPAWREVSSAAQAALHELGRTNRAGAD